VNSTTVEAGESDCGWVLCGERRETEGTFWRCTLLPAISCQRLLNERECCWLQRGIVASSLTRKRKFYMELSSTKTCEQRNNGCSLTRMQFCVPWSGVHLTVTTISSVSKYLSCLIFYINFDYLFYLKINQIKYNLLYKIV
jgi:hypothetical protein